MKRNELKLGSLLSYLQMALGIIIGLIYTPMMIRLLGQSEYGLYQTVSSTISMLSVLSLGFNAGYIRYYSRFRRNNDENAIDKLNGLFLIIFFIIGIIAFLCGLFLTNHLDLIFDKGLTTNEYQTAKVLTFISIINLSIMFPMTVFTNIITAHERFIYLKLLGIIKTVFSPLISLPLLLLGYRSVALVTVTFLLSLFTDCLYVFYVFRVLHSRFIFHGFEKGLFGNLLAYTSFIAINMIVDQINLNIDKILLGRFCGTGSVAVYSVGYTLYNYYQMFSTSISGVFTPRIHKIVNETSTNSKMQREALTNIFVKVGRIQFLVLALISTGMIFFGYPFIVYFWAGEGYEDAYAVALLLILPSSIALIQNLGIEIQRAENNHKFRSIVYLFMAIVNLLLSVFLCQKYGAIGSAIGTAISLVLANGLIMNIYYHKKCHINMITFWKNILKMSIALIPPIIFGISVQKVINLNSNLNLLISIAVYCIIYFASVWILAMNSYEKSMFIKPIKKIFNRGRRFSK